MQKVIRDGKVAVLYSPGFGAGWYSWSDLEWMLFDLRLVEAVERSASGSEIAKIANAIAAELGQDAPYTGGADQLEIKWVKQGDQFQVNEYDGSESIHVIGAGSYVTA